jgi:hypothetical protein
MAGRSTDRLDRDGAGESTERLLTSSVPRPADDAGHHPRPGLMAVRETETGYAGNGGMTRTMAPPAAITTT